MFYTIPLISLLKKLLNGPKNITSKQTKKEVQKVRYYKPQVKLSVRI